MADNIMTTPSGMGGLLRYNEEYPSKIKFTPEQIIIGIVIVAVAMTVIKLVL